METAIVVFTRDLRLHDNPALHQVVNPLRQAQRFDPDGSYVRRYVPELAALPADRIHTPGASTTPPAAACPTPAPWSI
jgi:deoxyribodipyrimidine photo-lyase